MSRTTAFMALFVIALSAPLSAQASPVARWRFRSGPHPITLHAALGPSDNRPLKHPRGLPPRAHRVVLGSLRPIATGWTTPLGLRFSLRW